MKKFLALILAVSLLLPSIPVQASTITERDLINLISESSDTLESYEFTDETAAYAALESAQTYVNTLSGNLDEVYNNLSSEMNALKLNDTSVDIPRIGEINKTYGINVDSLIPIIKEAEETNSGITWITGEVIYPEDLFFYMYYYGINSIEITLTDTNISDVINICEYASSTDMSICIDGKEDSLLSGYNVFYKNDMVVDKKVKTLTDQEMVNYILSNIYTDEIFYYNSDTLITTASTSNIIKTFNPIYPSHPQRVHLTLYGLFLKPFLFPTNFKYLYLPYTCPIFKLYKPFKPLQFSHVLIFIFFLANKNILLTIFSCPQL